MKIKPNYFSGQEARIKTIVRTDGMNYSVRENRMRFFFPDEWMSFVDLLKPKQKITFTFLINTGMRINEARNVRVCDIDFDRNSIIIKFTKSRNKDGSRKIRVIPISNQFSKYLRGLIKAFNLGAEDKFPILSTPSANIGMKKALRKMELKDWQNISVHNVRKSAEAWLMSMEVDSLKVAKHFGHTIAVAEKFYVSPDTFSWDDKQRIREILGDLYQK